MTHKIDLATHFHHATVCSRAAGAFYTMAALPLVQTLTVPGVLPKIVFGAMTGVVFGAGLLCDAKATKSKEQALKDYAPVVQ